MSFVTSAAPKPTSKVSRFTAAVRKNWAEARNADRELMALRTSLVRHVG